VEAGDERLLFDTGRGTAIRLSQMNVNLSSVDNIFFTHLHSDHIVGFPDVLMTGWVYQREKTLNIFGPSGTKNFVDNIKNAFNEDIKIRLEKPEELKMPGLKTYVKEISDGLVYRSKNVEVHAINVDHGGGVEHAYGYKINYKDKSVVISGDTNYSEELVNAATDVDILIHEIAAAPSSLINKSEKVRGIMNYHTTPEELTKIINQTKAKFTVLNHVLLLGGITEDRVLKLIKTNLDKDAEVMFGYDLLAIELTDRINTYSVDYTK
tara:strand:- start:168 stop:965 length:798 start_codon:yes stop_codon:yes gene_type:complete